MKSILEQFANGNIAPDVGTFKSGTPYARAVEIVASSEDKLLSKLEDELKEVFEKLMDAQMEAVLISNNDKFIYGYRLGVLMTMEVFTGRRDAIFDYKVFE